MTERRRGDRRQNGRRSGDATQGMESWLDALGLDDISMQGGLWSNNADLRFASDWARPGTEPNDSHFLARQTRRLVSSGAGAFQRIYRAFVAARAALGVMLVLTQGAIGLFTVRATLPLTVISVAYAAQAVSLWLLPRFQRSQTIDGMTRLRRSQWLATIGVDTLAFSALHILDPTSNLNYIALLVLPVLMGGVLVSRTMALATAALVTLVLLGSAWHAVLAGRDAAALMTQAGLAGGGFFVITLLAGELAGRLAREELTARGSLELARQQAQLNRLVIDEMQDGVLVVDRRIRVRTANPAARGLLAAEGLCRPAPFPLESEVIWRPLCEAVEQAFDRGLWPDAGRDIKLLFANGTTRTLRVRARFTRRHQTPSAMDTGEEFCVLFLEDLLSVETRTRQEKLAAMGRMSAGIAHEIRNPLAAIAQANALLQEDDLPDTHKQLTRMVADNVERLKRIVDDVMEAASSRPPVARVIDATAQVGATCTDWARTVQLDVNGGGRLRVELPAEPLGVTFDPEHLRRVLVNLLDNARRHASDAPGAIQLALVALDDDSTLLLVASDGPPIPPDVERYLFEPFFSTRSRGTGLGLYICRELCERYGASIDYRQRPAGEPNRNEFRVTMRRAAPAIPEVRMPPAS